MYWTNFSGSLPLIALLAAKGLEQAVSFLKEKWNLGVATALGIVVIAFASQHYLSAGWGAAVINGLPCGTLNPTCRSDITNLRSNKPLPEQWNIDQLLRPVVNDQSCNSQKACLLVLVSHRSQYFSDELFNYKLVQAFDQESRQPSTTFYPQRNIRIKRLSKENRPSSPQFYGDYVVFLTNANQQPRDFPVRHFGAADIEVEEINFVINELQKKSGKFKLLKELTLPNKEIAFLARVVR
jgi:hypothetical protein